MALFLPLASHHPRLSGAATSPTCQGLSSVHKPLPAKITLYSWPLFGTLELDGPPDPLRQKTSEFIYLSFITSPGAALEGMSNT